MSQKPDTTERAERPTWVTALLIVVVIGVVAYVLHAGGVLEKVSIPGWLEFDFSKPAASPRPVASRDFVLGKWEVEQPVGGNSSGTSITYNKDGTLTGWATVFDNNAGRREAWSGSWSFEKLSDDKFRLDAIINGIQRQATFRIFDQDHIQNVDNNYMAVRVP